MSEAPILSLRNVRKDYPIERGLLRRVTGHVKAVDGVDLDLNRGEILALVGESGSGKTTLGRCAIRAIEATSGTIALRTRSGEVVDLATASRRTLRRLRAEMNMVFQDPFSSLSPRMPVRDIIAEPLRAQGIGREEAEAKVSEIAGLVGLDAAHLSRYPNAFSGGQRQRIGIARALVTNPRLIVADEPVSALDVSIQAQILNLLLDLQERLALSILFVSHDLSVVEHMADRVAVMYLGRIVELAPTGDLYSRPRHPYTEALLSAVPKLDPGNRDQPIVLAGEIASNANPPPGCSFHPRCRYAQALCKERAPALEEVSAHRRVACHFAAELSLEGVPSE
jgi:peptide/nickel transport system ATP-binding protein